MKNISKKAFSACTALKKISLGLSLRQIEDGAFSDCPNLSNITCYSSIPPYAQFTSFDINAYDMVEVFVPQENLNDYKIDNIWKRFLKLNGLNMTGIATPSVSTPEATEVARYTADGHRIYAPVKGLNIIKMSDGTVKKVIVK